MNDSEDFLKVNGANGIDLWDVHIFSLQYADDLILIATNEHDRKLQMHLLGQYAEKCKTEINAKKAKVMVFSDKSWKNADKYFGCIGSNKIYTTDFYKYLEVTFDNKISFHKHVSTITEKTNTFLWALITKNREWKGFQPHLLLYLFDLLISPILSYGSEIWSDNDWVEIERIHLFIYKLSVGVKSSIPNDGIYAELGRYPLLICRQIKKIKYALRVWQMEDNRYAKKAMKVLITDDLKGHYNWVSQVIDLMKKNDICQTNIPFSSSGIKRNCVDSFNSDLMQRLKGCETSKKLRTYYDFKSMVKSESYLDILKTRNKEKSTTNLD